ncbi:MAG: hypothetical protein M0R06_13005 [Sphaerochaeta sp.]|nr:hypothetical protein [Sphaerochaeta sp.]
MAGYSAFATVLTKVGVGAIAELTSIGGPGISGETIDVTSHDSAAAAANAAAFREFVAGVKDGGSVSIEGNFTADASHLALFNDLAAGTRDNYTIEYPDGAGGVLATWDIDCIGTGFEITGAFDDKLSFSGSLKVSGVPTLT